MKQNYRGMQMKTPAENWREGMPCGNGSLCALVYGSISPETILFNHDRLWYQGHFAELPDVSDSLSEVRRLEQEGDLRTANDAYVKRLQELGFEAAEPIFHPAFDLKIKADTKEAFSDYCRQVNFETGEAIVHYRDGDNAVERRFFISRADQIGVLRMQSDQPIETLLQLCEHNLSDSREMGGTPAPIPLQFETRVERNMLILNVTGSNGGAYGAVLRLIAEDGEVSHATMASFTDQLSSLPILWGLGVDTRETFRLSASSRWTALIGVYVNTTDAAAAQNELISRLEGLEGDYDILLERHVKLHGELFNRCRLVLGDHYVNETANEQLLLDAYGGTPSLEWFVKQFDYGRYLLICCSAENSLPPTLQGSFNGEYYPPWNSFYVHNENTQMFYWQALPGQMPEVMGAMFRYFEGFLEDYRKNARNLYGCRGIFIPLVASASTGQLQDAAPHVIYFTGVAAWIASMFYDYWLYTGDKTFLKEHAIPFMEEVAAFYEDYLYIDQDGYVKIFPSNSPENSPANSMENEDLSIVMNPGIPLTVNSTIDTALVKETFRNLLSAYEALGIEHERAVRWKELLTKMRPYRINEDGALAEWVYEGHTDNYAHRHLSHIYPLFPGNELVNGSPELKAAVAKAIQKRTSIGLASQTGWSLVHLANVYARLGDANQAMNCLRILASSCVGKNLFTYHNDWRNMSVTLKVVLSGSAPYQIDANMGFTSAVYEMLAYSYGGRLKIFPALPAEWTKGSISGLGLRGGAKLDLQWNAEEGWADITLCSKWEQHIVVELPDYLELSGAQSAVTLFPNQPQTLKAVFKCS